MSRFLKKYWHLIALALIILLGSFLRFYRLPQSTSFLNDTVRDIDKVREIIQERKLVLLGPPTSIGSKEVGYGTVYFGPIFYYLLLPFLFLSRLDPMGPVLFVAALNSLSILGIFFLGLKIFDREYLALIISSLLCFSAGHIYYSRFVWNPNLLVFFSILSLIFFYLSLENKNSVYSFLLGIFLGVTIQLHYVSVFLGIFSFGYFFLKKEKRKFLFWMLLGELIIFSPLLIFELRHNYLNLRSLIFIINQGLSRARVGFSLYNLNLMIRKLNIFFIGLKGKFWSFLPLLFLLVAWKNRSAKTKPIIGLFLLGLFSLAFVNFNGVMTERYLLSFLPIYYLMLGIFLDDILENIGYFGSLGIIAVFFSFTLLHLFCEYPKIIKKNDKSLSFFQQNAYIVIQDFKKSCSINQKINIANLYSSDRRGESFRYFFMKEKLPLLPIDNYHDADILYVIDKDYNWDGIVNNTDTWEVYSFEPKVLLDTIDGPEGVKIYKIGKKKKNG